MIRKGLLFGVLATMGTGCSMSGKEGIWMFFLSVREAPECEESFEHNYVGANPEVDDTTSDWTEETTVEASEGIVFGQIFGSSGGDESKLLVLGDSLYTGTKDGGIWTFEWMNTELTTTTEDHTTGYSFDTTISESEHNIIELDFSGNGATGTVRTHTTNTRRWEESDTWDANEVGSPGGQTPAGAFLVDMDSVPVRNVFDATDCSGSPCILEFTNDCMSSGEIEAHQTEYDDDAFDGVDQAGQPIGLGGAI